MTDDPASPAPEASRPAFMGPEAPVAARPAPAGPLPRWVPWSMAAALVVGIGIGAAGASLLGDAGTTPAAGEAAGPDGGDGAAAITIPQAGADDPDAFGTVEVSGTALPRLAGGQDAAVGSPAPELRGFDFEGTPVAIIDDGRPKLVVFLSHWCPYCQDEVPVIRDWVGGGLVPDGVDVYSVSTLTEFGRSNYPPRSWFERESWNVPLIVDDRRDTAAGAFGLNAVPFWVLIGADGTIAGRGAGGGIPAESLTALATQLLEGAGS